MYNDCHTYYSHVLYVIYGVMYTGPSVYNDCHTYYSHVLYVIYGVMCTGPSGDAEGDMHCSTRG